MPISGRGHIILQNEKGSQDRLSPSTGCTTGRRRPGRYVMWIKFWIALARLSLRRRGCQTSAKEHGGDSPSESRHGTAGSLSVVRLLRHWAGEITGDPGASMRVRTQASKFATNHIGKPPVQTSVPPTDLRIGEIEHDCQNQRPGKADRSRSVGWRFWAAGFHVGVMRKLQWLGNPRPARPRLMCNQPVRA